MSEPRTCPNCGAAAPSRYCGECGQRQGVRLVSMRRLVGDVVEDHLALSGALPRTLGNLVARPGRLTAEYAAGRIVRYVAPFRLYLVATLAFFLTLAWTTAPDLEFAGAAGSAQEGAVEAPLEGGAAAGGEKASGVAGDSAEASPGVEAGPAAPSRPERSGGVTVNLPFADTAGVSPWARPLALRLMRQQERLEAMEPEAIIAALLAGLERNAPKAAFVALPLFALLLKALYIRGLRMYIEHFVFALHFHAFAFLAATAMLLVRSERVSALLSMWILVYLFWAMRRVYRQGWLRTTLKYFFLTGAYVVVLTFVIAAGVVFTALVI